MALKWVVYHFIFIQPDFLCGAPSLPSLLLSVYLYLCLYQSISISIYIYICLSLYSLSQLQMFSSTTTVIHMFFWQVLKMRAPHDHNDSRTFSRMSAYLSCYTATALGMFPILLKVETRGTRKWIWRRLADLWPQAALLWSDGAWT